MHNISKIEKGVYKMTEENKEKNYDEKTKFCKYCGKKIPDEAIICTKCGRQVEEIKKSGGEQIVINNNANAVANASANITGTPMMARNKWVAFILCLLLGIFGVHKFYEGKAVLGIIYFFTCGLFGIGVIVDLIVILFRPNPYYV